MSNNTEVAADLVVNDRAGGAINKVKAGFENLNKRVDHAIGGMKSFAKQTASTALGVHLAGFGGTLTNVYHEALEAGMELGKQQKSVASALMMTEKGDRGYKEVREQANGLQEELQNVAIAAGASSDALIESFNDIASRTNKSTDEVKDFMGTMVQAARIAPGGLASITQGFEQIEMGVARARNPIVQMIASTGLLQGNARQVAKQMQKMAPDQMMALAEKAITRMAGKMKSIPLTFGESMQAMKEMRGQLFEIVGMPIFKGITPMVQELQKQMKAHRHELEAFAEKVGAKATDAFKFAGAKVKDAFVLINDNWESIARSMSQVADTFMTAGKFLLDQKELLGRMAMLGSGGFVAGGQVRGNESAGGLLKSAGGDVLGGALAGGKLGGPTGAALGASLGAMGTMFQEATSLGSALADWADPLHRDTEAVRKNAEWLEERNKKNASSNEAIRQHIAELEKFKAASQSLLGAYGKGPGGASAMDMKDVGFGALTETMVNRAAVELDAGTQQLAMTMATDFKAMMDYAQQSNDANAMNAVQNTLANSQRLQYALAVSGVDVGKGFDDLIDAMIEGGRMTAEAGKKAKEMVKGGKDLSKLSKPTVSVGGGNTINVKQEFREGDPDRIVMALKGAVTKAALGRINARVSGPFGGF